MSLIVPADEDINTKQERISAERFADNILILCDKCDWCCMYFNANGLIDSCPLCRSQVSQIPMTLGEVCIVEFLDNRGLTLTFSRNKYQPI